MLGTLLLFLGCLGQALFWPVYPSAPARYGQIAFLLVPFAVIFVINLANVSPVSPRVHLRVCFGAMIWWAFITALTEALYLIGRFSVPPGAQTLLAHVLMHSGWLGFIPVWRLRARLRESGLL